MRNILLQTGIFTGTMISTTLVNVPGMLLYAQWSGLLVQPFWLVASYNAKQWGPFALAIYFVLVWSVGLLNSYGVM